MKKSIIFILIFLFASQINAQRVRERTPAGIVSHLYSIYVNKNFRKALFITTGKEKAKVQAVMKRMNQNFGRPPAHVASFIAKIQELKIIKEEIVVKDKYAAVDVLWIQKIKDKDHANRYKYKASEVTYLLKMIKGLWYIKSSKMGKQHIIYNYDQHMNRLNKIYKNAKPCKGSRRK